MGDGYQAKVRASAGFKTRVDKSRGNADGTNTGENQAESQYKTDETKKRVGRRESSGGKAIVGRERG